MNKTPIEWCRTYAEDGSYTEGYSVNPVRFRPHGSDRLVTMCQKVSPGCAHCYAEGITRRFWPKDGLYQIDEVGQHWNFDEFPGYTALGVSAATGEFVLDEKTLLSVLKQRKPGKVFWGDMTDLFGEWVEDEWLDSCFAVMALTPHLTHILLTKRPARMLAYMEKMRRAWVLRLSHAINFHAEFVKHADAPGRPMPCWPLPNVWLGVSVENQKAADERLMYVHRFAADGWQTMVSFEPLLSSIALHPAWLSLGGRTWAIVGGESGPVARPMHPDCARGLRDQCVAAGVPFFFKQWGEWGPCENGEVTPNPQDWDNPPAEHTFARQDVPRSGWEQVWKVGKKAAGRLLDGREWNEMPEVAR